MRHSRTQPSQLTGGPARSSPGDRFKADEGEQAPALLRRIHPATQRVTVKARLVGYCSVVRWASAAASRICTLP